MRFKKEKEKKMLVVVEKINRGPHQTSKAGRGEELSSARGSCVISIFHARNNEQREEKMAPRNLRKKRVAESDDEEEADVGLQQTLQERIEDARTLIKNRAKAKVRKPSSTHKNKKKTKKKPLPPQKAKCNPKKIVAIHLRTPLSLFLCSALAERG